MLAISFRLDRSSTSHWPVVRLILKDKTDHSFRCGGFWTVDGPEYVAIWDLDDRRSEGGIYEAEIRDGESVLAQFQLRNLPVVTP
jgi:hypothetical protein